MDNPCRAYAQARRRPRPGRKSPLWTCVLQLERGRSGSSLFKQLSRMSMIAARGRSSEPGRIFVWWRRCCVVDVDVLESRSKKHIRVPNWQNFIKRGGQPLAGGYYRKNDAARLVADMRPTWTDKPQFDLARKPRETELRRGAKQTHFFRSCIQPALRTSRAHTRPA